jgi:pantoate--beta-alanine ligase
MKTLQITPSISQLRRQLTPWRHDGERIALVPTMGALHEGHISLVRQANSLAQRVVVSIFVNPTQFAPHEDFAAYPRTLKSDCDKLSNTQAVDLVFSPAPEEMYPPGFATGLTMGGAASGLESDFRPHFFGGVATVVAKLLIASLPDIAIFGEKDYQQLLVVRQLARDLGLPTEIVGAPIVRETDGLALSSRNIYLSTSERLIAGKLNRILAEACQRLRSGETILQVESHSANALRLAGFDTVDYVAVRDAHTLAPLKQLEGPARILAAAKVGKTRLIDNMAI